MPSKNKLSSLRHDDQLIFYEIERKPSVTRRIHLHANPDGSLRVVAPKRMSKRAVHQSLQEMAPRVAGFLTRALDRLQETPKYRYIHGEQHYYLGKQYPLAVSARPGKRATARLGDACIEITTPDGQPESVRKKLLAWYRQQAFEQFARRLEAISETAPWINGQAPTLRLRNMKRTWGSCSSKGVITLNPRMLKAPEACIDYVIAHEICHLQEMNHGKAFYALQEMLYPDWRAAKAHLRSQAHIYLES